MQIYNKQWRWFSLLAALLVITGCSVNQTENKGEKLLENPWEYAAQVKKGIVPPAFRNIDYTITDFGAISDGKTDCSKAIAAAILKCNTEGGGRVVVPAGTFLTGAIHLKSNINLHIAEGATLLFTTDKTAYLPVVHTRFEGMECMNYSPLIYAYQQKNIALTGKGTIDGQGQAWWSWKGKWEGSVDHGYDDTNAETQHRDNVLLTQMVADNVPVEQRVFGDGYFLRPSFVQFYECENILIEGIKIVQSPMWIIHPVLSNNITVRGVTIESLGPNNDGCDPESSTNVLIEDCYFDTGDDCIAIKSGRNNDGRRISRASENILIQNCTMIEGHGGVVMGSEISGNVRYVFAENCVMDSPNLDRAIRIKSNSLRGGIIEHIYVRNIDVKQVKEAVLKIEMHYGGETGPNFPLARNIVLENIKAESSKYGVWIQAYKEMPAQNIILRNCTFNNIQKENHIVNARDISFNRVFVNEREVEN